MPAKIPHLTSIASTGIVHHPSQHDAIWNAAIGDLKIGLPHPTGIGDHLYAALVYDGEDWYECRTDHIDRLVKLWLPDGQNDGHGQERLALFISLLTTIRTPLERNEKGLYSLPVSEIAHQQLAKVAQVLTKGTA